MQFNNESVGQIIRNINKRFYLKLLNGKKDKNISQGSKSGPEINKRLKLLIDRWYEYYMVLRNS